MKFSHTHLHVVVALHGCVLAARPGLEAEVEAAVARVAALVAQKRVQLLVVDVAALPALVRVLVAVAADAVPIRHRARAPTGSELRE